MPRAYNLTTFMCRLSWNLGNSTSWNPQGLSSPVMGLLYLYEYLCRLLLHSMCSVCLLVCLLVSHSVMHAAVEVMTLFPSHDCDHKGENRIICVANWKTLEAVRNYVSVLYGKFNLCCQMCQELQTGVVHSRARQINWYTLTLWPTCCM
jgi:hypothetical protein